MPLSCVFIRLLDPGQKVGPGLVEGGEEAALLSEVRAGGCPLFNIAAVPPAQHVGVVLHNVFHIYSPQRFNNHFT